MLEQLPVEVLIHLFSFFTAVERARILSAVCLQWQEICQASYFWKEMTLPEDRNIAYRRMLRRHKDHLQTLNVNGRGVLDKRICLTRLKTIRIRNLSTVVMGRIIHTCPNIKEIVICHSNLRPPAFVPLYRLPQLRWITISCILWVTEKPDDILFTIAKTCTGLERVSLSFGPYGQTHNDGIQVLCQDHRTTLTHLSLKYWYMKTVKPLLTCCRLTHLELIYCDMEDEEMVSLNGLTELRYLTLMTYPSSPSVLAHLLQGCVKLTHARLIDVRITAEVMHHLATSCSHLESLEIKPTHPFPDHLLMPLLDQSRQLRYLSLSWSSLTEEVIGLIPRKLPVLWVLNLYLSPKMTQELRRQWPALKLNASLEPSWFDDYFYKFSESYI